MRIAYVANVRMPTEKAHGAQIAKMCEAFVRAGAEVELVVPRRRTDIAGSMFEYYGLKEVFPVTTCFAIDSVSWGFLGYLFEMFSFTCAALFARGVRTADIVYGRDEFVLFLLSWVGIKHIMWESHTGAWNWVARALATRAERVIVISKGLRDFYVARGVPEENILVAHDAVDPADFALPETKAVACSRLGLDASKKIVLYIGSLGGWKGVETLLEASALIQPAEVVIIGGSAEQITKLRSTYPRVRFLGTLPYRDLANNQAAADVLVLPNTGRDIRATHFTSPLKLFAYMMSKRPIVASDLPSIREVLPLRAAYWFIPDDARSCAKAINDALHDLDAHERAAIAQREATHYTWDTRARNILAIF